MRRVGILACVLVAGLVFLPRAGVTQGYSEAPSVPEPKQVEAVQNRIETQPETMETIRALQSDPQFQDVLNDPDIAAALESGNTAALLANPKIRNLADHPVIQDMTKKLGQ